MQNLYTGSAGQAAVMSEFLVRGYNVAVPEVDRGDDLFVVEDTSGILSRIQVKAAIGKRRKKTDAYAAQVIVPTLQLTTPQTPELTYVFVLRCDDRWKDFVVLTRPILDDLHRHQDVGTASTKAVVLTLVVSASDVLCSKRDLSVHRNDFSNWPRIVH